MHAIRDICKFLLIPVNIFLLSKLSLVMYLAWRFSSSFLLKQMKSLMQHC